MHSYTPAIPFIFRPVPFWEFMALFLTFSLVFILFFIAQHWRTHRAPLFAVSCILSDDDGNLDFSENVFVELLTVSIFHVQFSLILLSFDLSRKISVVFGTEKFCRKFVLFFVYIHIAYATQFTPQNPATVIQWRCKFSKNLKSRKLLTN